MCSWWSRWQRPTAETARPPSSLRRPPPPRPCPFRRLLTPRSHPHRLALLCPLIRPRHRCLCAPRCASWEAAPTLAPSPACSPLRPSAVARPWRRALWRSPRNLRRDRPLLRPQPPRSSRSLSSPQPTAAAPPRCSLLWCARVSAPSAVERGVDALGTGPLLPRRWRQRCHLLPARRTNLLSGRLARRQPTRRRRGGRLKPVRNINNTSYVLIKFHCAALVLDCITSLIRNHSSPGCACTRKDVQPAEIGRTCSSHSPQWHLKRSISSAGLQRMIAINLASTEQQPQPAKQPQLQPLPSAPHETTPVLRSRHPACFRIRRAAAAVVVLVAAKP